LAISVNSIPSPATNANSLAQTAQCVPVGPPRPPINHSGAPNAQLTCPADAQTNTRLGGGRLPAKWQEVAKHCLPGPSTWALSLGEGWPPPARPQARPKSRQHARQLTPPRRPATVSRWPLPSIFRLLPSAFCYIFSLLPPAFSPTLSGGLGGGQLEWRAAVCSLQTLSGELQHWAALRRARRDLVCPQTGANAVRNKQSARGTKSLRPNLRARALAACERQSAGDPLDWQQAEQARSSNALGPLSWPSSNVETGAKVSN